MNLMNLYGSLLLAAYVECKTAKRKDDLKIRPFSLFADAGEAPQAPETSST